eukprot:CAMPEP_0168331774 /NCGR_PEP_ID=MMETSP0213-20121227/8536_1 /TAXON_ID=151035 /ORGANISM="Euplotes harpa, Strain FSP1.4" /LENGTH=100 /DNA_ID=CAMNT_0008335619 /DNA_START=388 /DNA_END=690 /DNA_ORIENTATION=-
MTEVRNEVISNLELEQLAEVIAKAPANEINLEADKIGEQFFVSNSFWYFLKEIDLLAILHKLLVKLHSNFRNFMKRSMDIRKVCSVFKNICESHLNCEMK